MRLRFARDCKTKRRLLLLRSKGAETIDPRMQRWLEEHGGAVPICGMAHVTRGRRATEVGIDVEGLTSLRGYLHRAELDACAVSQMLQDIVEAVSLCVSGGFRYDALLYDARYVFVDGDGRLLFVFSPLRGTSFVAQNSPLALLRVLGDKRRMRIGDANGTALCERVKRYAEDEGGIFSLNRLREFVRAETQLEPVGSIAAHVRANTQTDGAKRAFVLRDTSTGATYPLVENVACRTGRGEECDVRVRGYPSVSRIHASICVRGARVVLRDLGSTNGTYVRGARVLPQTEVDVRVGAEFFLSDNPFCVERA